MKRTKKISRQRTQFLVALLVVIAIVFAVVLVCSPTTRHNLKEAFSSLSVLGTSPSDYQSGEALKETEGGQYR